MMNSLCTHTFIQLHIPIILFQSLKTAIAFVTALIPINSHQHISL